MMLRMPLPASIAGCRGVGIGRRRRQMPRSPADGILGLPDVYRLNDSATCVRATSAWDRVGNRIVGANQRRRKAVTIGSTPYFADLVESPATNLLAAGTSDQFTSTGWLLDSLDIVYTADQAGPSADLPATLCVETTTTSGRVIIAQNVSKAASAIQYTASLLVKKYSGSRFVLSTISDNAGSGAQTILDVDAGTLSLTGPYGASPFTGISASVESWQGDFWRVNLTATTNTATVVRFEPQMRAVAGVFSYVGDGTSGIYIAGASLVQGPLPGTHVSNRNLLLRSEELDSVAAWSQTRATVAANQRANPLDGSLTMDKLLDSTDVGTQHYISQAFTKAASSLTMTLTAYAYPSDYPGITLRCSDTGFTNAAFCRFNLTTGAMQTGTSGAGWAVVSNDMTLMADGSYRCRVTVTTDTTTIIRSAIMIWNGTLGTDSFTGTGALGVFVYGAQLQYGNATSYWCVQGTTGQRSGDSLISTFTFGQAGSLFTVAEPVGWTGDQDGATAFRLWQSGGASANLRLLRGSATTLNFQHADAGGAQAVNGVTHALVSGQRSTYTQTWDATAVRAYVGGTASGADTTLTPPYETPTTLNIGMANGGGAYANAYVLVLLKHDAAWPASDVALLTSETRAAG
jgi:hypothetical protein